MKTHLVIDNLNENLAQKKIDFEETFGRFIEELEFQDKNIE
jgi:hypothetical protein